MNTVLNSALTLTYNQLSTFSGLNKFWQVFDTAFGTQYNRSGAEILRLQWQSGDFSQLPQIEILDSSILGGANGAYASSNNKIYLSNSFFANATTEAISAVLLEEIGHFVDAHINPVDSVSHQGEIFAALLPGRTFGDTTLQLLQTDDNHPNIPDSNIQQATVTGSGDIRIDSLLGGFKWGVPTISYSFYSGGSFYGSEVGLATVSDAIKTSVRHFLENTIEPLINVNFVEVSDSSSSYGLLRYFLSTDPDYAYAYYPFSTDSNQGNENDLAGDVFLNSSFDDNLDTNGFQGGIGTHGYTTLIHETLHALGLKHPGDYNGGGTGDPPFLPFAGDNLDNTIMTYNFAGASPGTPMPYDLLALQYLYGAKSFNSSDTTYTFSYADLYSDGLRTVGSSSDFSKLTIWDSGGIDTLDFSNSSTGFGGYHFDLKAGGWLTTENAFNAETYQALSDTSGTEYVATTYGTRIGYGVQIEKAIGSSSNDTFYGNTQNNFLFGGSGNDTLVYTGTFSQYQISTASTPGVFTITDFVANRDGIDILDSIESIQFSDQTITLNDFATITLSVAPNSVLEDGTTNLIYTFTRTGSTANALTVNYSVGGTAASTDYTGATPGTGKTITFAANSATATLTIDPTADTTIESNETVALTLVAGTGYTLGTTTAVTGTITNDDSPTITLSVAPNSVLEDGTTNLIYTFTRTGSTANALTVNYSVGGTAASTDYTGATPGTGKTITFAANSATATLTIDPTADTTIESNETVALTLVAGTGYTLGTTTAVTGTITNDDSPTITLSVAPNSVLEDGTTNLIYTFTRTGSTANALTVNYSVGGTAASTDYTGATPGTGKTITFAANSATATLTIDPTADTTIESNETVALTLVAGTGYTLGTTTAVTGTITNDDSPTITLSVAPNSVLEDGTTNLIYTFTRTGSTANALTVNYSVGGTAASTDYTGATPGTGKTITFAANSATATLTINPTADTSIEANETVALTLVAGTGYTLGTTTAVTGTITNDDSPTITLSVAPNSVLEDGTTNLIYTFTRTGSTANALTVNYSVGGTAASTDYTGATPGTGKTITFAANSATATLTIDPTADTTIESNETVALTLVAGTGYTLGTTTAVTGTITNDDLLPNINLSANQTIVEGFTSPQNVTYTVTLTSASSQSITVQYATANGTAIAGSDYTSTSGTLTFNPGFTSQVINIPILNDSINEANETFTVTLSSPTNANLGTSKTVTTTITDTLSASVTTTLPTNVENLTLTGTTAINGTGNAGNNILRGNSANNTLTGLNGNDIYAFVANSALGIDTITETTIGGIDTISFSGTTVAVNVNLGVDTSQTVNSNLKLILSANNVIENATGGTANDRLTGNTLNNTLNGGDGNDLLQGLGGNDNLWGGVGNDILDGGTGNDSLWGGLGDDVLTGGVGNDKYLFQSSSVFATSLGIDYISDFEVGIDQIVLSKTTFNAITNLTGQALTDFAVVTDDQFVNASNARVVFSQGTGSLFYNQDGNVLGATAVFEFARLGNPDITLSGSNFSLIA